jgi:hypothetical protein
MIMKGRKTNSIKVMKARRVRWVGHVTRMGEITVYRALVEKPEVKSSLRRPSRRGMII